MAQIFPFPPHEHRSAAFYGYECVRGGSPVQRGLLCRLRLHRPAERVVFAAQHSAGTRESEGLPALLYDDPAKTVEELLFSSVALEREWNDDGATHRLFALQDATKVNIVCTELQQKRLILADGIDVWERALAVSIASKNPPEPEHKLLSDSVHPHGYLHLSPERPEDAVSALLLNEEDEGLRFEAMHRILRKLEGLDRFVDRARLLFHIEHLPGTMSEERVRYLLGHGNELGMAMVVVVAGEAYLMKVRTDVVEALLPSPPNASVPDICILQLFLRRALGADLSDAEASASLACALEQSRTAPVFCLNAVTTQQVQYAALRQQPLPAETFRLACAPPTRWMVP